MYVTEDGRVYGFGFGAHGQLGNGETNNLPNPTRGRSIEHLKAEKVVCGWNHTLVLTAGGKVYATGNGKHG